MDTVDRHLTPLSGSATPEEAAAIVAALERFMRATAPPSAPVDRIGDPWLGAAILEGVSREPQSQAQDPWLRASG